MSLCHAPVEASSSKQCQLMALKWSPEAEATRMDMYIEHATRFSSLVKKLREDVMLAKEVLTDWKDWRDEREAITIFEKHGV